MGKIPTGGEYLDYDAWRFEVTEMERNRIKDVKVTPLKTAAKG